MPQSLVDFMAQPSLMHEPTDPDPLPERRVDQQEFNDACDRWGGFVNFADGAYYLDLETETLVLDAEVMAP